MLASMVRTGFDPRPDRRERRAEGFAAELDALPDLYGDILQQPHGLAEAAGPFDQAAEPVDQLSGPDDQRPDTDADQGTAQGDQRDRHAANTQSRAGQRKHQLAAQYGGKRRGNGGDLADMVEQALDGAPERAGGNRTDDPTASKHMTTPETIRIFVPLEYRRRNGRTQILRALARAWEWRRKLETGEANTISDLAADAGLADRHVSRQIRLAYLAPAVIERLMVKQEIPAVRIIDLIDAASLPWVEQEAAVFAKG
jgi:hypothetical protein